jgi:DNA-binding response OmpR family regulator
MTHDETKNYSGKAAILVDDDIDLLQQLKFHLETMGFKVYTGESQAQGEDLIKEKDFDLAVFDLMMENQDSGFILSYKTKKKNSSIPVILVTGVSGETGLQFDAATKETRSWIKADVVLDKDIRFEQLQKEIDRLL